MSKSEDHSCPWDGCERSFDSDRGLKVHHAQAHGESIAFETVECATCGVSFEKRTKEAKHDENHFCGRPCYNEWLSDAMSGEGNNSWKGGVSRYTAECDYCGEEFSRHASNQAERMEHDFCSQECYGQWLSENRFGEDHPSWKETTKSVLYGSNWYRKRQEALERDNKECQECGAEEGLEVHHLVKIQYFAKRDVPNVEDASVLRNLITLCTFCHPDFREDQRDCPKPPEHWSNQNP